MQNITPAADRSIPRLIDRRELLRSWKLGTFCLGTALMVIGVDFYKISDWDLGISLIMPALTYLTAPWVMRVLLLGRWRAWPEALFWTWFTVDGVYWGYHTAVGNEMLRQENFTTSLPLYLFMGGIWLYRGRLVDLWAEVRGQSVRSHPVPMRDRNPALRFSFAFVAIGAIYALAIEPFWIEVTHHRIGRTASPRETIRIVQLSDLHISRLGWRENMVARSLEALRPEVIVLSGDAVDRADNLDALDVFLAKLPQVPRFAVNGNWEYWSGVDLSAMSRIYQRNGVTLLENQSVTVTARTGKFALTGLDDAGEGRADWQKATLSPETEGLPRIVIQHTPEWRDELDQLTVGAKNARPMVVLSGHTHGGQINFFGWRPYLPGGTGNYPAGWYREDGGTPLYVSRGLGTSMLPFRFGSRPEIAVFDLAL